MREIVDAKSIKQQCDVFRVSKEACVAGAQSGQRETSRRSQGGGGKI